MIQIKVSKQELEKFFDTLQEDYKWINLNNKISFNSFKEYFCDDFLRINEKLSKKSIDSFKKIYRDISSSNTKFYKKIREFIIETFTSNSKFCPYCWKSSLIYFERWKDKSNSYHRLFQFDHFFPKNVYHKWIINFYNLIPSCNACNHLKNDDNPFDLWVIFHPYFWKLTFMDGEIQKLDENFVDKNNFIDESIYKSRYWKFFKLWQKYLNSKDTFNTFDFIQDKRNKIKDLKSKFPNLNFTDEYYKEFFFSWYYPKINWDILKYSNWKLKKDLIDDLDF